MSGGFAPSISTLPELTCARCRSKDSAVTRLDPGAAQSSLACGVPREQRAPIGVVHFARLGLVQELAQNVGQRLGIFQMREVRGARQHAKAAVGDCFVGTAAVLERDRV